MKGSPALAARKRVLEAAVLNAFLVMILTCGGGASVMDPQSKDIA